MPLNKKGKKIMNEMADEYGEKKDVKYFINQKEKGRLNQ